MRTIQKNRRKTVGPLAGRTRASLTVPRGVPGRRRLDPHQLELSVGVRGPSRNDRPIDVSN